VGHFVRQGLRFDVVDSGPDDVNRAVVPFHGFPQQPSTDWSASMTCGEGRAAGSRQIGESEAFHGLVRRFPDALTPEPHPAADFDRGNASW
jgi:hypothetical protein